MKIGIWSLHQSNYVLYLSIFECKYKTPDDTQIKEIRFVPINKLNTIILYILSGSCNNNVFLKLLRGKYKALYFRFYPDQVGGN